MNGPTQYPNLEPQSGVTSLVSWIPVPGFGVLPANAFVIDSREPVLVDTGLAALREPFMEALRTAIDPSRLRWIWVTHSDADHVGNLEAVLREAPRARVVTTFLGMGKMGMLGLPADRVYLLNPGQSLDLGDRVLTATTLPTYDAPETVGVFDESTSTLFSADSFGALLDRPVQNASQIAPRALREGSIRWATIDAPWLGSVEAKSFRRALGAIQELDVQTVLGSHLPPAFGMTKRLLGYLDEARAAPRFIGPDQPALERMMAA